MVQRINDLKISTYGKQDDIAQFFLPTPTWIDQVALTADTNSNYTVPTGAIYLVILSPYDAYIRMDAAAAVPAAGITDGTGSMPIYTETAAGINVRGVTTVGIISAVASYATIIAYR